MKNGWLPCLDPLFWRGGSGVALLGKVERSCLNIEVNCPRSRLRLINNHIGSYISSMVVQRIWLVLYIRAFFAFNVFSMVVTLPPIWTLKGFFCVGLLRSQWPFHAWNKHVTFLAMVQDPKNGYCNTCATSPTLVLQNSSFSGQHQTHIGWTIG
jgi:hypothetical protein